MAFWDKVTQVANAVLPGLDLVSAKYGADRQSELNREAKGMDAAENLNAFIRTSQREDAVWEREKQYAAELWDKQNAYNSPAAQMARYKEAGINPLMVASQGTPGNATVIKAPDLGHSEYRAAKMEPARYDIRSNSMSAGILNAMGIRNAALESRNIEARTALIAAQANVTKEAARGAKRENDYYEKTGGSLTDPGWLKVISRWFRKAQSNDWLPSDSEFTTGRFRGDVSNPSLLPPHIFLKIENKGGD